VALESWIYWLCSHGGRRGNWPSGREGSSRPIGDKDEALDSPEIASVAEERGGDEGDGTARKIDLAKNRWQKSTVGNVPKLATRHSRATQSSPASPLVPLSPPSFPSLADMISLKRRLASSLSLALAGITLPGKFLGFMSHGQVFSSVFFTRALCC
jgi:hypothetical protein